MKSWFKARLTWGAGIDALSDAEAGRFAKALWKYETTHEETPLQGTEKVLLALALMELRQDEASETELSNVRAEAGRMGGKQKQANLANASLATDNLANLASATNKNKNKNKNKEKEEEGDVYTPTTARTCVETPFGDVTINEAQNYAQTYLTGLTMTHLEEVDQFTDIVGVDLVKHAIDEAVANSVRSWAYVRAILQGYIKNNIKTVAEADAKKQERKNTTTPAGKQVTAQQYTQRSYTEDELEERSAMADILAEAASL